MPTAEYFFESILIEGKGVYALTWEDKGDLVRTLIILAALFNGKPTYPLLLTSAELVERELGFLFSIKPLPQNQYDEFGNQTDLQRDSFLLLFLDQASGRSIGPLLNGWRSALAQPPGTLLIIRSPDFIDFQRNAPDLASFIGPRIFDTATMLSMWGATTADKIRAQIPLEIKKILERLPGEDLSEREIAEWIKLHPPVERG
jgi:hypothetical protein